MLIRRSRRLRRSRRVQIRVPVARRQFQRQRLRRLDARHVYFIILVRVRRDETVSRHPFRQHRRAVRDIDTSHRPRPDDHAADRARARPRAPTPPSPPRARPARAVSQSLPHPRHPRFSIHLARASSVVIVPRPRPRDGSRARLLSTPRASITRLARATPRSIDDCGRVRRTPLAIDDRILILGTTQSIDETEVLGDVACAMSKSYGEELNAHWRGLRWPTKDVQATSASTGSWVGLASAIEVDAIAGLRDGRAYCCGGRSGASGSGSWSCASCQSGV